MAATPSILFVHDSFPAQFGGLGRWLAARGWQVAFATAAADARAEGVRILRYAPHRAASAATHPYAQPMDRAAIRAQAFVRAAMTARDAGYRPDIIVAHSGWGAGMFAKDVFPGAAYVAYCEWWYRHPGVDIAFLGALEGVQHPTPLEAPMHERARNAPIAMDLAAADAAICPTAFQAAQFPQRLRPLLGVMHDGIDADLYTPCARRDDPTLGGLVPEDARLVTYATRGMEPHRGFPQFMAAAPGILAADPRAMIVIAGENRVVYGGDAIRRTDWKARALRENAIDPARVRFVGRLGQRDYLALLRRSDAHVYLTVPFVLSWSMLEAMSAGCAVVLSDTAPVREYADAGSAALCDFARPASIAEAVRETLSDLTAARARRARAHDTVRTSVSSEIEFARKARMFAELRR
jgi:glycosyltransferase involved in cell wall biosynthesis